MEREREREKGRKREGEREKERERRGEREGRDYIQRSHRTHSDLWATCMARSNRKAKKLKKNKD